jgi:hypothetical protein
VSVEGTQTLRSDGDGGLTLPGPGPWRLTCEEHGFRLLLPDKTYSRTEEPGDVWCYRYRRVRGRVTLERPEKAPEGSVFVAARPATPGGVPRGEPAVGTAAWMERLIHKARLPWKALVRDGEYEIEVPLLKDMTLAATAPGHIVETRAVPPVDSSAQTRSIDFHLRAGAAVSVRVVGEDGLPLKGAVVRLICTFQVKTEEFNLEEFRLRKRAAGGSFGALGNDATGMTTVRFTVGRRTDEEGRADLSQIASEGKLLLWVTHPGTEPHLAEVTGTAEPDAGDLTLSRTRPVREGYRLAWNGKYVAPGSGLQLLVMTEGLSLPAAAIAADGDGVFPSESIVPGREYFAIVSDRREVGHRSGLVRFGSEEVVDISSFD